MNDTGSGVEREACSLPRSAMLNTPDTLLLALRWKIFLSDGDEERVSMAESTFESSAISVAMMKKCCDG